MFPQLHYKDTQHYKGYHIEIVVQVDFRDTLTVNCRELNGKLPNKVYTDRVDTMGAWRHLLPDYHGRGGYLAEVGDAIIEMFHKGLYLDLYVRDTAPKPIIRKPVDRKRISRGRKDRVFRLLKELQNA
jgi:hypothetical protein